MLVAKVQLVSGIEVKSSVGVHTSMLEDAWPELCPFLDAALALPFFLGFGSLLRSSSP